jgi:hypothetical protein
MPKCKRINNKERRTAPRVSASKVIPDGTTELITGQEVELVNISLSGAILIYSKVMLLPGSPVRLKLKIPGHSMNIGGRIQRCRVVALKNAKIQYEAAIILNKAFPQPLAERLRLLGGEDLQTEQYSLKEAAPDEMVLPETAQLWVLDEQGVGAEA